MWWHCEPEGQSKRQRQRRRSEITQKQRGARSAERAWTLWQCHTSKQAQQQKKANSWGPSRRPGTKPARASQGLPLHKSHWLLETALMETLANWQRWTPRPAWPLDSLHLTSPCVAEAVVWWADRRQAKIDRYHEQQLQSGHTDKHSLFKLSLLSHSLRAGVHYLTLYVDILGMSLNHYINFCKDERIDKLKKATPGNTLSSHSARSILHFIVYSFTHLSLTPHSLLSPSRSSLTLSLSFSPSFSLSCSQYKVCHAHKLSKTSWLGSCENLMGNWDQMSLPDWMRHTQAHTQTQCGVFQVHGLGTNLGKPTQSKW